MEVEKREQISATAQPAKETLAAKCYSESQKRVGGDVERGELDVFKELVKLI